MIEKSLLYKLVNDALDELYENDSYLISNHNNGYNHVSERGIVFRFGIYFEKIVKKNLPGYNLDSEYNRNNGLIKKLPNRKNGSFPDIIVHKRGTNSDNLLVLEFKTWWNSDIGEDVRKIKEFCDKEGTYRFYTGAVICLERVREEVMIWHIEGV